MEVGASALKPYEINFQEVSYVVEKKKANLPGAFGCLFSVAGK